MNIVMRKLSAIFLALIIATSSSTSIITASKKRKNNKQKDKKALFKKKLKKKTPNSSQTNIDFAKYIEESLSSSSSSSSPSSLLSFPPVPPAFEEEKKDQDNKTISTTCSHAENKIPQDNKDYFSIVGDTKVLNDCFSCYEKIVAEKTGTELPFLILASSEQVSKEDKSIWPYLKLQGIPRISLKEDKALNIQMFTNIPKNQTVNCLFIYGDHGLVGEMFKNKPESWWRVNVVAPLEKIKFKTNLIILEACLSASMVNVFKPLLTENGLIIGGMVLVRKNTLDTPIFSDLVKELIENKEISDTKKITQAISHRFLTDLPQDPYIHHLFLDAINFFSAKNAFSNNYPEICQLIQTLNLGCSNIQNAFTLQKIDQNQVDIKLLKQLETKLIENTTTIRQISNELIIKEANIPFASCRPILNKLDTKLKIFQRPVFDSWQKILNGELAADPGTLAFSDDCFLHYDKMMMLVARELVTNQYVQLPRTPSMYGIYSQASKRLYYDEGFNNADYIRLSEAVAKKSAEVTSKDYKDPISSTLSQSHTEEYNMLLNHQLVLKHLDLYKRIFTCQAADFSDPEFFQGLFKK